MPEGALSLPEAHDGIASAIPLESKKLEKLLNLTLLNITLLHTAVPNTTVPL